MPFRKVRHRDEPRYKVVDETPYTWAVRDLDTGEIVEGGFRDPLAARQFIERMGDVEDD